MRGGLTASVFFLILLILSVGSPRNTHAQDTRYGIQVAAFKQASLAAKEVETLKQKGYQAFYRQENLKDRGVWYRVYLAEFSNRDQARHCATGLKADGAISEFYIRAISAPDPSHRTANQTDQYDSTGLHFRVPGERDKTGTVSSRRSTRLQTKTEKDAPVLGDCASRPASGEHLLEVRSPLSPNAFNTFASTPTIEAGGDATPKGNSQAEVKDPPSQRPDKNISPFGPRVRPTTLATWDLGGTDLVPFFSSGRVEDHYGWGKSAGGYDHDLGQEAMLGLSLVAPF